MIRNTIDVVLGGYDNGLTPNVQQYDTNSRVFACRLLTPEGELFQLADDAVVGAVYKYRRCSGTHEYETVIENRSTVVVTVPAEAVQLEGKVEMQLKIHQNGGVLNSPVVMFAALRSLKTSETETNEPALILVALVDEVQNLINRIETSLENGEFDGDPGVTPVRGEHYWTESDKKAIVSEVLSYFTNVSEVGM